MNLDEFRIEMTNYWQLLDAEVNSSKDSGLAREKLHSIYVKFDAKERAMADEVISEWVLSENDALRFDALVLVHDFKIYLARPNLQSLTSRLTSSSLPGAPYELEKVNRILQSI